MAWGLQRFQLDPAQYDRVTVAERREGIFSLRGRTEVNRRALTITELEMAGDEVRVKMREEDVRDLQPVSGGEREVLIDVSLGIDDGSGSARLVRDEIRRVREAIQIELLQNHVSWRSYREGWEESKPGRQAHQVVVNRLSDS